MIDPPQIISTPLQHVAAIRIQAAQSDMRHLISPAREELQAAVDEQGIGTGAAWFIHYLQCDDEIADFAICMPVHGPVKAIGRVSTREIAPSLVAYTVYQGGYEYLADAWHTFTDWIETFGHAPAEDFWECYAIGPESFRNTAQWRTQLYRPLLTATDRLPSIEFS